MNLARHHQIMLAIGAGFLAGFVLADAPSGTWIYSTPIGQSLANLYTFGADKAGAAATPAAAPVAC